MGMSGYYRKKLGEPKELEAAPEPVVEEAPVAEDAAQEAAPDDKPKKKAK